MALSDGEMPANSHFEFRRVPIIFQMESVMLLKPSSTLLLATAPTA